MRLEDYDASPKDQTYRGVDFGAATFDDCLMEGARFKNVDLRGVVIRGAWLEAEITGEVERLTVNGVFATDAWIRRALLGDPSPWSPLDLPHDDMADIPEVPRDRDVRPSLDEVLTLRRERMATVRQVVDGLTEEQLAGTTTPITESGYPESKAFPVSDVVGCIVNEEWHHHQYATRDLTVLEQRAPA